MSGKRLLVGAIEAGGTKFLCAIADRYGRTIAEKRIASVGPGETLAEVHAFFLSHVCEHGALDALSIGSFGPLSLNPAAKDYGAITSTPKSGWQNVDLVSRFADIVAGPITLDTDVNCAAVAEELFGNGRGRDTFCYVTVGTGIGVGTIIEGTPHGGANHPEAGHIRLPRASGDESFSGTCPYHGDCLEGLACGPAMHLRWGAPAETLPSDHPAWDIEAYYIAGLCVSLTYILRPDRIILGGGVMDGPGMLPRVREQLTRSLAGYDVSVRALDMNEYLVSPTAGISAGLTGALALSFRAATGEWPMHWALGLTDARPSRFDRKP